MATNVSERDKALVVHLEHFGANAQGQYTALLILKDQIKAMLGYSGSMPSEVPNQSEGAK